MHHKTWATPSGNGAISARRRPLSSRALALSPDHAEAHFNRAILKTFHRGDPDLAALEALAADTGRSASRRQMVYVHFALGKGAGRHWRLSRGPSSNGSGAMP